MKKTLAILLTLVMIFTLGAVTVFADGETVTITTAAGLEAAIRDQKTGQTWNIAAGVYDISPNTTITESAQTGWYFPIIANNITINGAGIDKTVITSSVLSKNGVLATQDMISVWSDNVTIKNLTIRSKLETNKAIEIMGKNFMAQNVAIRNNEIVSHADYCTFMACTPGSNYNYDPITDVESGDAWGRFGGSVYFNPQNAGKDIGTATLDNVLITQAWISCTTSKVSAGTLNLTGGTTIDFRNSFFAGTLPVTAVGYGVLSPGTNFDVINATDFKVIYDSTADAQKQIIERVPAGTTLIKADKSTEVTANADVAYMVIIPASVNFGTIIRDDGIKTKDFDVSVVSALVESGYSIKVQNTTTPLEMKDKNGTGSKTLPFVLTQPSGLFTFTAAALEDGKETITTGKLTCDTANLLVAGAYRGYMTFSVDYVTP